MADQPFIDTPIDLLLDADDDIVTDGGDLALSSGLEGVRQAVDGAIRLALGEWFLDDSAGVDWWGKILVKGPNALVVNQILRDAILTVPFVSEVTSVSVEFTSAARELAVTWRAVCDFGVIQSVTPVLGG